MAGATVAVALSATAATGITAGLGAGVCAWLLVPHLAHRAFVRGRFGQARVMFAILAWVALGARDRLAARCAVAACRVATGDHARALSILDNVRGDGLAPPQRAAWLNNRAYALGRDGRDLVHALALVDEAIAIHGDIAAFVHTRGVILLGLGRATDAARDLSAAWQSKRAESAFESERCFDLGHAWRRAGRGDLATDYFRRAIKAAPKSAWSERAAEILGHRDGAAPSTFYSPGIDAT